MLLAKADSSLSDAQLQMIATTSDEQLGLTRRRLHKIWRRLFAWEPTAIRPTRRRGTFHRLFVVDSPRGRFVLKVRVAPDERFSRPLTTEAIIAQALRRSGLPAPSIVHVDDTRDVCPYDLFVMRFAPGDDLHALDADEDAILALLLNLGGVVSKIHDAALDESVRRLLLSQQTPLHSWRDRFYLNLDENLTVCRGGGALAENERREVSRRLRDGEALIDRAPTALLHMDLGNHNLLTNGTAITCVLDWEDALLGDPAFDVAIWASFHPHRRHAALLRSYLEEGGGRDESFDERFRLSYLRATVAKIAHRIRFAAPQMPGRPSSAERLQAALNTCRLKTA